MDIKYEGFVEKTSTGILRNSSKIWMVLDNSTIAFFKDSKKSICSGSIDVSEIVSTSVSGKKDYKEFTVTTPNKSYTFVSESAKVTENWALAIQQSINVHNSTTSDRVDLGLRNSGRESPRQQSSSKFYLPDENENDEPQTRNTIFGVALKPSRKSKTSSRTSIEEDSKAIDGATATDGSKTKAVQDRLSSSRVSNPASVELKQTASATAEANTCTQPVRPTLTQKPNNMFSEVLDKSGVDAAANNKGVVSKKRPSFKPPPPPARKQQHQPTPNTGISSFKPMNAGAQTGDNLVNSSLSDRPNSDSNSLDTSRNTTSLRCKAMSMDDASTSGLPAVPETSTVGGSPVQMRRSTQRSSETGNQLDKGSVGNQDDDEVDTSHVVMRKSGRARSTLAPRSFSEDAINDGTHSREYNDFTKGMSTIEGLTCTDKSRRSNNLRKQSNVIDDVDVDDDDAIGGEDSAAIDDAVIQRILSIPEDEQIPQALPEDLALDAYKQLKAYFDATNGGRFDSASHVPSVSSPVTELKKLLLANV